eukprot:scaffold17506_cov132-Isochrysis_galbana.AAC.3
MHQITNQPLAPGHAACWMLGRDSSPATVRPPAPPDTDRNHTSTRVVGDSRDRGPFLNLK